MTNTAIYAGTALSPVNIDTNSPDIIGSGFTTIILGLCHIGRGPEAHDPVQGQHTGDLVFNNPSESTTDPSKNGLIMISEGKYVGPDSWTSALLNLQSGYGGYGEISRVGWSFGGGGCLDYQTIWSNYVKNGKISSDTTLYKNFQTLKSQFPFIDFIDFDCEEFDSSYDHTYNWTEALIAFGNMLKEIGFNITFCPYGRNSDWMGVLKTLYSSKGATVEWINLQCYDGGSGQDPKTWVTDINNTGLGIDASAFLLPGLWCCNTSKPYYGSTPKDMQDTFSQWQTELKNAGLPVLKGGFVWNYDDILNNENSTSCNTEYTKPKKAVDYDKGIVSGLG